jgi:multidrug resistance efflux pump
MSVLPVVALLGAAALALSVWKTNLFPANLTGRVETIQANVVSTKPGALTQLNVARFQMIKMGDPVATVITTDPKIVNASLAVIRAEVEMLQASLTPLDNTQRNAINYEQLRLELMRVRVQLATSKANLLQAESEFSRQDRLFKDQLISESDYDIARRNRDALQAQVQEEGKLVVATEAQLHRLDQVQSNLLDPQRQLNASIETQDKKLKLVEAEFSPLILTAPIDGLVCMIHRHNGENIAAGDPIITVSATHTDHIIGYLRQPLQVEPTTNMMVRIRTRNAQKQISEGRILAVGAHLQPINDALLPPTRMDNTDLGLPILVNLPKDLKVHPGETVDLTIMPDK